MKYRFRQNSPYKNKDAKTVGHYLNEKFPDNNVTPTAVVELAKVSTSPLHEFFDWDDKTAAEKHRLHQARQLISALYVELDNGTQIRAYENVYIEMNDTNSYTAIGDIQNAPELYEQVIESALKELEYWKFKYEKYQSYFGRIFSEIDNVMAEGPGVSSGKGKEDQRSGRDVKESRNSTDRKDNGKNHNSGRQPSSRMQVQRKGKKSTRRQTSKESRENTRSP